MNCFAPVAADSSKILILGSFPSPKSFESGFYYGHPHNRFWPMLARLLDEPAPKSVEEKSALLLRHDIALWDVLDSCRIQGASDASIRDPVVNDVAALVRGTAVRAVFFNGAKAAELYRRYCPPLSVPTCRMPSTSPANAAWSMERLMDSWKAILPYLSD